MDHIEGAYEWKNEGVLIDGFNGKFGDVRVKTSEYTIILFWKSES